MLPEFNKDWEDRGIVVIGGDPTRGHVVEIKECRIDEASWKRFVNAFPDAQPFLLKTGTSISDFDLVQKHLKCSICRCELPRGTSLSWKGLVTQTHIRSSLRISHTNGFTNLPDEECILLLCGTNRDQGCIHKALQFFEILPEQDAIDDLLRSM